MNDDRTISLTDKPLNWLAYNNNEDADIIFSTRVRMARNLSHHLFPSKADNEELEHVYQQIMNSTQAHVGDESNLFCRITSLSDLDKQILLERKLLSNKLLVKGHASGFGLINGGSLSIMINEEDHLRIQETLPGLNLWGAWEKVREIGDKLAEQLAFAYDKSLGFLTTQPVNVGTGTRFSVLMQLPGLTLTKQLPAVVRGATNLGLSLRHPFGNDPETAGYLFVLANRSTLGETETCMLTRLRRVVKQLLPAERNARESLLDNDCEGLYDYIGRAYGILRYASRLGRDEAFRYLCIVRFGVSQGMFSQLDYEVLDELLTLCQPGHLRMREQVASDNTEIQDARAKVIRRGLM